MRAILVFGLLSMLSLAACGDEEEGVPAAPVKREKGTPTGAPVTQVVGAAGGQVSAGRLEVDIPAGALSADTTIVLTPLTSTAPGARGGAWRLEPEGVTFASPVTLRVTWEDSDLRGAAAEVLGIAYQDPSGLWVMPGAQTRDVAAHRVEVKTTHFSDWGFVTTALLRPPLARVKTRESLALVARRCFDQPPEPPDLAHAEQPPYYIGYDCESDARGVIPLPLKVTGWSVNGVEGGNSTTGTISGGSAGTGTFGAPAKKPSPATVAASVRLPTDEYGMVLLVSNITITDGSRLMRATGRYEATTMLSTAVVEGHVVDEGVRFWFNFPSTPESGNTYRFEAMAGGGVTDVHDIRPRCMQPSLSGGWDVLTPTSITSFGGSFGVEGTFSHGEVTHGIDGEGDCTSDVEVEPAEQGAFAEMFSFPVDYFSSAEPPEDPVVLTDGPWKWTFEPEPD